MGSVTRFLRVLTISNGIGYDILYDGNSPNCAKHLVEFREFKFLIRK